MNRPGRLLVVGTCVLSCWGRVLAESPLAALDNSKPQQPVVMRFDLELDRLVEEAKATPRLLRSFWLSKRLQQSQKDICVRFGMPNIGLYAKYLLGEKDLPKVKLHRDALKNRDLEKEIRTAYVRVAKKLGKTHPKAPIYKVAYGYQEYTNAAMIGVDRESGRHVVLLNRSALEEKKGWESALLHESVHTFQGEMGTTLTERAIYEGVATYITKLIEPKLVDHQVLLWTAEKWKAAEARREKIIAAFAKAKDETEPKVTVPFLFLHEKLTSVDGAPDRTGYYVGYLACKAWHERNANRTAADLLAAKPDEILHALLSK